MRFLVSRVRLAGKAAAVTVGVILVGCNSPSLPPAPSPIPQSATPQPPPPPSSAVVTIESPFAIVSPDGARFGYAVRFLLRETDGRSGATIERIVVTGPSGSDEAGPGCWRDSLRVPPKGELDTFYTDTGARWLGYCGPGSGGQTASPLLDVVVTYRDDNGVVASVGAPIRTLR